MRLERRARHAYRLEVSQSNLRLKQSLVTLVAASDGCAVEKASLRHKIDFSVPEWRLLHTEILAGTGSRSAECVG